MELFLDRLSPGRSSLALSESLALEEGGATARLSGSLAVDNMDQKVLVHGQFEVRRMMECHRCGEPCEQCYTAGLELMILRAPARGRERRSDEPDNWVIHATQGVVDLSEAVREAVVLDEPLLVRCTRDCALPGGAEQGSPEAEIDPRWAKLRELQPDQGQDEASGRERRGRR